MYLEVEVHYLRLQNNNNINITSPNMTRFHITKKEAISHSINCLDRMIGGEIFI